MRVLSYSPSVEMYAMVGDGEMVDLTPDIVSCEVSRKCDAHSTFAAVLQNKGHKYNGVFSCFDKVVVYATKNSRQKLFSGFITSFDAFKLYQTDFSISGRCTLYRLQQLYFDPGLYESQRIWCLNDPSGGGMQDSGYANIAKRMLTQVGDWPESMIDIQENVPEDVIKWAEEMFAAKLDETSQLKSWIDEFYEVLRTHGPKITKGGASQSGGESGGLNLSADEAKASADQKHLVEVAVSGSVGGTANWCLQWVNDVYQAAGFPFARYWGAIEVWNHREEHVSYGTSMTGIPLGACVVTTGQGSGGAGHIGIYIGGGNVISEVGGQRTETVEQFGSWEPMDTIDGMHGWCGWVCPDCGMDWK